MNSETAAIRWRKFKLNLPRTRSTDSLGVYKQRHNVRWKFSDPEWNLQAWEDQVAMYKNASTVPP